jgi:hypothetical protein
VCRGLLLFMSKTPLRSCCQFCSCRRLVDCSYRPGVGIGTWACTFEGLSSGGGDVSRSGCVVATVSWWATEAVWRPAEATRTAGDAAHSVFSVNFLLRGLKYFIETPFDSIHSHKCSTCSHSV